MTCVINKPTKEYISKYYKDTINKNRVFNYNYELYENYDYTKLLSCMAHNIKIVFPSNIKQKLKTHFNFELNDGYSNHCHTTDFNNLKHIVEKFSMFSIYNKNLMQCMQYIMSHITDEFINPSENFSQHNINTKCLIHYFKDYNIAETDTHSILYTENIVMLFNKDMSYYVTMSINKILLFGIDKMIVININNITDIALSIATQKSNEKVTNSKDSVFGITEDIVNGIATVYNNNYINQIIFSSDNTKQQYFNICTDTITKDTIKQYLCIDINGTIFKKTLENNIMTSYYKDNNIEKLISTCMMTNNNSVQYGKYTAVKTSDDNTNIKIELDDKLLYNKNNNNILVDTITPKDIIVDEYIIGWKVVKSFNDELRIIKLGIPHDALKVLPIGEDYFSTFRKERCNRAIVLDIQLPNLEEIISVVPNEKVAHSYIYEKITEYTVGHMVEPDGFNNNINESCGMGIHFHRDRRAVFKMWIKGYENIKYEY